MNSGQLRVEYLPLGSIQRAKVNPKRHATEDLSISVGRFGYVDPMIRDDATGRIVAGHGRLDALLERQQSGHEPPRNVQLRADGEWLIPVLVGNSFENEDEASAFLIGSNRLSEYGGWEQEQLNAMIHDLSERGVSMEGVGWSPQQIEAMIREATEGVPEPVQPGAGEGGGSDKVTDSASEMNQINLFLDPEQYAQATADLGRLMKREGLADYTAAFLWLLERDKHPAGRNPQPDAPNAS